MTLAVGIAGEESIWLMVDRRLTANKPPVNGRYEVLTDDATKLLVLDATDGVALLGYSGLGLTVGGMEPSTWMSNLLLGPERTVEESLSAIVQVANAELPRHLERFPGDPRHQIIVPAFVNDERRFYVIQIGVRPNRYQFDRARVRPNKYTPLLISGSGLNAMRYRTSYARDLLGPVRLHDRGRMSPDDVAKALAAINYRVHQQTSDGTVGPDCIVVWRIRKIGGGGHAYFKGVERLDDTPALPSIWRGEDSKKMGEAMHALFGPPLLAMLEGEQFAEPDPDTISAALTSLPSDPDPNLR